MKYPLSVVVPARRRLRLQEHLRAADVDLVHDDARHDARHRPDVDAVRQRFELLAGDDRLLQRARRVEQRRFAGHGHAFRHGANFELQVGAGGRVGVDQDVADLERPEPLHLAFDDVGAGLKAQKLIGAALVGTRSADSRRSCLAGSRA